MTTDSPLLRLVTATKTIGHPARLRILAMLRHHRLSVCQIAAVLDVPPSTAAGYLLELRRGNLVSEQREGTWVYYRLRDDDEVDALLRLVFVLLESDIQVRQDAAAARALDRAPLAQVCAAAGQRGPVPLPD